MDADYEHLERLLAELRDEAHRTGMRIYVAGGWIRDLLLRATPPKRDVDFVVEGNALEFARSVAERLGAAEVRTFDRFLTAKLMTPSRYPGLDQIDFATAREETYERPGELPLVRPSTIAHDLARRDFSCNALAIGVPELLAWLAGAREIEALEHNVLDQFDGCRAIAERVVHVLHPRSFIDDPSRLFRAVRYETRFDGTLGTETAELFEFASEHGALETLAPFRRLTEIRKSMCEWRPHLILRRLLERGVFDTFRLIDAEGLSRVQSMLERIAAAHDWCGPETRSELGMTALFAVYLERSNTAWRELGFAKKEIDARKELAARVSSPPSLHEASEVLLATLALLSPDEGLRIEARNELFRTAPGARL